MTIAPMRAEKAARPIRHVTTSDQTKTGIRIIDMRGARIRSAVQRTQTDQIRPEAAAKNTAAIHRSSPLLGELIESERGRYEYQPVSAAPPAVRKPESMRVA